MLVPGFSENCLIPFSVITAKVLLEPIEYFLYSLNYFMGGKMKKKT